MKMIHKFVGKVVSAVMMRNDKRIVVIETGKGYFVIKKPFRNLEVG